MSITRGTVIRSLEEKNSKKQLGKDGTQGLLDPVVGLQYFRKFQHDWPKSYTWLKSSSLGPDMASCIPCNANFSVGSRMQKGTLKGWTTRKQLLLNRRAILLKALSKHSVESQVSCAETLFCEFIAEHNIAFLAADHDHFTEICKQDCCTICL